MKERPGITPSIGQGVEREDRVEQLAQFIGSIASEYRRDFDLPVGDDGRIAMARYQSLYPDTMQDMQRAGRYLESDTAKTAEYVQQRYGKTPAEVSRSESTTDGEKLEMLAFASFAKNLGPRFIVARASHLDDQENKVDTILIDAETGNLVCVFDEVGDTSDGVDYQMKQKKVRERNTKLGGATLKYGVRLEKKDDQKRFVPAEIKNIPLFYVALSKGRIEAGIENFVSSRTEQSDYEVKLFEYFIGALTFQITSLELYSQYLNPDLKKRLRDFKMVTEEIIMRKKATQAKK
jgi:hypothetical protein